jgi:hypothetical protein
MQIISTTTSWNCGAWEVWGLVRDEQGGMAKRLLLRTTDLDVAVDAENAARS